MTIREQTEEIERKILSPYAARAAESRGRARPQTPCEFRTDYQRDRDRIIHQCKSFRRLSHKTQVFATSLLQDHIRTRMTHTLEVSQIARTIARALRLNEDLIEAIALGHDLGHPPFAHAGEEALDWVVRETVPELGGFRHYEHSVRLVEELENNGRGVNLTYETLDGIRYHTKGERDTPHRLDGPHPMTLEGKIVRWADRIAYVNHDIDDAIRAGVLKRSDLPREPLRVLGEEHGVRIGTIVGDIVGHSADKPFLEMSPEVCEAINSLKNFLFDRVYLSKQPVGAGPRVPEAPPEPGPRQALPASGARPLTVSDQQSGVGEVQEATTAGPEIVRSLFLYYLEHPDQAPFLTAEDRAADTVHRARLSLDYVAGMTDRFAWEQFLSTDKHR